jgi:hypothetical protein
MLQVLDHTACEQRWLRDSNNFRTAIKSDVSDGLLAVTQLVDQKLNYLCQQLV